MSAIAIANIGKLVIVLILLAVFALVMKQLFKGKKKRK